MQERENRFNQLMFGSSRKREQKEDGFSESSLANVDWNQLMSQCQEIAVSLQSLKPVIKELSPLLDLFQKKAK
ncbi:hypothetical protein [Priestia abyssalis]|uniref:hypothetical protein n=1 Tax=Priestia abyssalis TaxID=1221450 RepID=UPI0009954E8C|nr:hypothetical protein [Priestia abyssalis]